MFDIAYERIMSLPLNLLKTGSRDFYFAKAKHGTSVYSVTPLVKFWLVQRRHRGRYI